jgi:hypothetical protein
LREEEPTIAIAGITRPGQDHPLQGEVVTMIWFRTERSTLGAARTVERRCKRPNPVATESSGVAEPSHGMRHVIVIGTAKTAETDERTTHLQSNPRPSAAAVLKSLILQTFPS